MLESVSRRVGMRELIASVAGERRWSDTRESWLARAVRKAGISYRQCKALWYAEIKDEHHRSARLMRDAAEKYEAIASALNQSDPAFHSEDIAALIDLARKMRDLGSTES
jgi:hypothetical protein